MPDKVASRCSRSTGLIADVLATDVLVLAFPLHNFSVPVAIKAYFDAIMLNSSLENSFFIGQALNDTRQPKWYTHWPMN